LAEKERVPFLKKAKMYLKPIPRRDTSSGTNNGKKKKIEFEIAIYKK